MGVLLRSIACAFVLLVPGNARADWALEATVGISGALMRRTPTLSSERVSTLAREIPENTPLKTRGHLAFGGVTSDLELSIDNRWKVPLFGGGLYLPVGSYAPEIGSLDGSITRLRPWSAFRADILLPGIGRRFTHRRWQWGATVRAGYSFLTMNGSVAAGAFREDASFSARSVMVQVELDGCRRLDPLLRACIQVAPRLYDYGPINGLSVGLRMEWD